jgi:signal transduction histidine kinase
MIDILNSKKISFEHKAEELRNSIGNGMANDNVSAVICKFKKTRNIKKRITWLLLIIAMILLIAVLDHIFFLRRPIVELLLRIGD